MESHPVGHEAKSGQQGQAMPRAMRVLLQNNNTTVGPLCQETMHTDEHQSNMLHHRLGTVL